MTMLTRSMSIPRPKTSVATIILFWKSLNDLYLAILLLLLLLLIIDITYYRLNNLYMLVYINKVYNIYYILIDKFIFLLVSFHHEYRYLGNYNHTTICLVH